ncbi:hypothetical protein J8273_0912 [Carpediemonas membranifera]|uniref:Uncharacterized protein n=1 Tax=Carpediemonas membranifera TaxID=201153 RepID=A0A8J6E4N6_9EUKA|nr:hypothetical protein J8273_0912 [Carpediemonas membranifera]|eukprot:KAG9397418.1 hypothetical protein J8273_0912 [Carpediemonas membranifera]
MLDLFTWLEEATEFEKKELMTKINAAASAKGKCDVLRALLLPRRDLLATVIKERTLLSEIVYTGVNLKRIATFFRLTRQETEDMKKDLKAQFMATTKLNEGERVTGEHKKTLKQVLGGDTFTHLYDGEVESARIRVKKSIREARMKTNARLECELAKEEDEDIRDCTRVQMMKLADEEDRKELEKEMEYTRESKYDVVWERVYDEICGTRRVRARKDNAPCPGEDHADHVLQRYLWADQIDTQALTGEKTLTTRLPAEARVVRRVTASLISAQKTEIQSLKEQVERLTKQVTDERRDHFLECRRIHHEHDVGYLASCDVSFAASPIPPQSGTLSRTSCPRRDTDEAQAAMSVKRKAITTEPEKARPEDSEEESEEEAKEKRGKAEEEAVNTCDACIQTEPEKARPVTCETGTEVNEGDDRTPTDDKDVQTEEREDCLDEFTRHLRSNFKPYNPPGDGDCVGHCLRHVSNERDVPTTDWREQLQAAAGIMQKRDLLPADYQLFYSHASSTGKGGKNDSLPYCRDTAIQVWSQIHNMPIASIQDGTIVFFQGRDKGYITLTNTNASMSVIRVIANVIGVNYYIYISGTPTDVTAHAEVYHVTPVELRKAESHLSAQQNTEDDCYFVE